jgi:hypothetical protein
MKPGLAPIILMEPLYKLTAVHLDGEVRYPGRVGVTTNGNIWRHMFLSKIGRDG